MTAATLHLLITLCSSLKPSHTRSPPSPLLLPLLPTPPPPPDHGKSLEPGDKLRLLLCYLATHPEKLDATKAQQWVTAAGLDRADMDTLTNLAFLNVAVMKPEQQVCVCVCVCV